MRRLNGRPGIAFPASAPLTVRATGIMDRSMANGQLTMSTVVFWYSRRAPSRWACTASASGMVAVRSCLGSQVGAGEVYDRVDLESSRAGGPRRRRYR